MDREQIIALWLFHRRRKRQKRNPRLWVHPINQRREEVGLFYTLFEDLRNDENNFFNYFRMSIASYDELHGKLKDALQRQNTQFRNCIQPIEMLAVTLRYLASGCTFTELHYNYRIGISTASKIVKDVCRTIWSLMREDCIPTPTPEIWESIASGFESTANFPHCLGAVDGKHILLTAVADSRYRFVYVDVGIYGKDCDSSIFKQSRLWQSIENNSQQLPEEKSLPGTECPKVPYFFVGDEAFGLNKHLLRPFGGTHLTVEKRIFHYRLCRARRYVECAFGILTNKWRVFHRPINVEPDFAVIIVNACIVLHNFVRKRDGFVVEDTTSVTGLEDLPPGNTTRGGLTANNVRNTLCKYFVSNIGSVSWQMSKI
ncbi:uncharacterized protein [Anabrus simplex]|uniref:uncharacterized protein n=1 Tax=Anabrus simplex TaxID=316456 RepID=UPI0035A31DC6